MKNFYITTPLYYINDVPHIGHAYTTVVADVIARYKKLSGNDVFFLTGTDEHGLKVEEAALKQDKNPQDYADSIVNNFKDLSNILNITNNDFIRTTQKRHIDFVQKIFSKLYNNGYIYKDNYKGLYCVGCEDYILERNLVDGKCKIHKKEPIEISEEGYFFKLSKFKDKLIEIYENNPEIIQPKSKMNEILSRLKNNNLNDICITRKQTKWGIPLSFDKDYVLWVWSDALFNYLSVFKDLDSDECKKYWPASVHLIGKDILWFHTVVWHSYLLALDLKLPKQVFAHGFWTIDGHKMSKSVGNVISPKDIVKDYGEEILRYTLLKDVTFGYDGDFSKDRLIDHYNNDFVGNLGNLVNRTLVMSFKYLDGKISKPNEILKDDQEIIDKLNSLIDSYKKDMDSFRFNFALKDIWALLDKLNAYINKTEPWVLYKNNEIKRIQTIIYILNETIRNISILINPFIPKSSQKIADVYDFKIDSFNNLKFGLLKENYLLKENKLILFEKIK